MSDVGVEIMILLIFIAFTSFVGFIVTYFQRAHQYWSKRNVPQLPTSIPFGNANNPFKTRRAFYYTVQHFYNEFKSKGHKHGGIYMTTRPIYIPVHPEYVKNIMTRHFQHFYDRGTYYNERADPLTAHLFNLEGQKWRNMRQKLTPTFTSGKMKMMFPTLLECGKQMVEAIDKLVVASEPVEIREILGCYSTDVIGSCAFGLDCNSFKEPDAEFRRNGRNIFKPTFKRKLRIFLVMTCPSICRMLGLVFIPKEVSNFFLDVVKEVVEFRQKNNVKRNDFMQLLLDMKDSDGANALSVQQMAAQAFVFFVAGFETSATTMNFCLFELAQNSDIQERTRREIQDVLENHGDCLTYEAVMDTKYLGQVIDETLRKYPPVSNLGRKCTEDYHIPGTDVILEKNKKVFISVLGLHRDPEFYPDPDRFDPDRFSEEEKVKRHPYTFLPFGEGPRNCIGARFGTMQTKVGLMLLLKNYRVTLDSRTELPLEMETTALLMTPRNKIWLNLEKLDN